MNRTCVCVLSGLVVGVACFGQGEAVEAEPEAYPFTEAQKANRYIKDFQRWAKADLGNIPMRDGVLCVGSSSMRGWKDIKTDLAPLKVIHRGFGGSTMGHVLVFKDFLLRYEAATILVYEGDNDLVSKKSKPQTFVNNCKAFCEAVFAVRSDTKVHFICAKPSPSRWHRWPAFCEGNAMLKAFCETDARLGFIDVSKGMLGEDGLPRAEIFKKDRLHMNRKGYEIWRDIVRAALIPEDSE
ncbi:MAG: GDSL family lipase [Lentisphaerae bacterium]|nr:GDSL family lipase [Lentisphaerota bacterium]MBT4818362.1 GDSL family lipase [Lentisphaerota bacterium]MBT5610745.1 GDSL family lipase [Lentisphaerota bacterium]MBT7060827.1 GDSL family lipase [Lentisphaerota bacterium]MBT7841284.1 GDSL family lipase [Lentisphaerota bacterium]